MKLPNNRLHKGPQKACGFGNSGFIIKRTSSIVRIPFVACEAERYKMEGDMKNKGFTFIEILIVLAIILTIAFPIIRIVYSNELREIDSKINNFLGNKEIA